MCDGEASGYTAYRTKGYRLFQAESCRRGPQLYPDGEEDVQRMDDMLLLCRMLVNVPFSALRPDSGIILLNRLVQILLFF